MKAAQLLVPIEEHAAIPTTVTDLASFRNWLDSDEFPEAGRISFIDGMVCVDMSKEELFVHGQLKTLIASVLFLLIQTARKGRYWCDGAYVSCPEVGLSTVPDGVYVAAASLRKGRCKYGESKRSKGAYIDIVGSPDMILEVVSASSVQKDKIRLRELYWRAGISEYWLVDVRGKRFQFDILQRAKTGYVESPLQDGWIASQVFGKSFRLSRRIGGDGHAEFTLDVK